MKFSVIHFIALFFMGTAVPLKADGGKILIIVSNATTYGQTTLPTANHFAEIILAYDEFVKAGYQVDFVSPNGGEVPIGYIDNESNIESQYLADKAFMHKLKNTLPPQQIAPSAYKAVYFGGGGAAMFGVPECKMIQEIAMSVYEDYEGVISAICHGSAGLAHLEKKNGKPLVRGKKVCGFPDIFERKEDAYYASFPFSIEQKLSEHGGTFSYSKEGWDGYYVVDGRLITGQDPTAARLVAQKVIEQLRE